MAHRTHLGKGKGLLLVATASLEDSHKTEFQIHSMFLWAGKPHEMSHLFGLESPFIMSWLVGLDNLFLLRTSSVEGVYEVALGELSTWK